MNNFTACQKLVHSLQPTSRIKLWKPIRDNPKIFTKSAKNVFKIRKNIANRNVFLEIIVEEFIKSERLLQILIKLLNPQILFCKSQTNLQIQELSLNPKKYFANSKKYIGSHVTLCQQHATVSHPADKFCFRCGSKVADISHPSARISTPEDESASSSSSTKSLSQYLASKAEEPRTQRI